MKRQLHARSGPELDEELSWWIQDASYSTAEVRWDRAARVVVVPLVHPCYEPGFPPAVPANRTVWADYSYRPWFRSTLTVRAVRSMAPPPEALDEPGIYEDLEWMADRHVLHLDSANSDASFDLEVDKLDVLLVVTDEIDHWRKHSRGRILGSYGFGAALEGDPPAG